MRYGFLRNVIHKIWDETQEYINEIQNIEKDFISSVHYHYFCHKSRVDLLYTSRCLIVTHSFMWQPYIFCVVGTIAVK